MTDYEIELEATVTGLEEQVDAMRQTMAVQSKLNQENVETVKQLRNENELLHNYLASKLAHEVLLLDEFKYYTEILQIENKGFKKLIRNYASHIAQLKRYIKSWKQGKKRK